MSLEDAAQAAQRSLEHTLTDTQMHSSIHVRRLTRSLSIHIHIGIVLLSLLSLVHYISLHSLWPSPLSSFILSELHRGVRKAAVRRIRGNQLKQFSLVTL